MSYETPEQIERRLARERAEIGNTIDALQERLSPGQFVDHALGYMKTTGAEVASRVGRTAKENPWPLVVTGVGLAWLVASAARNSNGNSARSAAGIDHRPDHPLVDDDSDSMLQRARDAAESVQRSAGEAESRFQERVTEAKAKALSLKREAGESAEKFRDRVDAKFGELRTRAAAKARALRERASAAQERTKELYSAEPLVAGALGVLAGALLGALVPTTRTEDRLIGEHAQRIRQGAVDMAAEAAKRAEKAAVEGARAAADAAEESIRQQA